ncbi:hypothetical protein F2Q70_00020098 [Brassica cretica]|uniref:OBG-type G domain-containing protein n=1 Tax=Brassica cretica TaxID=69181 RepID=A0A8S9GRE9_BRACR|nr:hypothetical protein F2Q70_00020098 [Brassica cretica]
MGGMFGSVEDYGEMFQDAVAHTSGASLSSENQIENPVVYKLVRVAQDGRLVPATDEEMLEVKDLVENNENDMSVVPDPGQYEYICDEGSPSQFLQLDSLEGSVTITPKHIIRFPYPTQLLNPGFFQSETAEAYTDNLNSRLEVCPPPLELLQSKEELVYGSQMPFPLLDTNYHSSNELPGDEEFVLSEVLLQEPVCFSSDGCGIDQPMDVSPYSNAAGGSPKAPAVSTTASSPGASRDTEEICLGNLSIKALQDTFRATFGRETTCKDKLWLQRKIKMGRVNPCVIPTTSQTVNDNKLILGGQDNCNDTSVDEGRASNCKGTPSSPNDFVKGHPNDFEYSPVEAFVDHYSGNEDFEGEYRSAKRVRKATRRYIEEISKVDDEKQESKESLIPSKDERSISTVSSGRRVVVTRMVSLGGSIIQVPYVSHVRRSRPRENIMALGEFHSKSWEVKAMPEESNLSVSQSQLNSDVKRVSGVKSVSGPDQKKLTTHRQSYKDHSKPEVDEDIMEPEYMDSSGDSSDDSSYNRVDRPVTQSAMRRKHHRAWSLSEVKNLVEEYHLGQLKAKIAKLRTQLLEPPKGASGGGEGFEVTKYGHGRVALIGFPSVGKSTLLTMLTGTHSEAASYEFTTLTCIPGVIHYNDTKIQLLDLPGIIEGASEGKGRGRQVIAVAKSSDLVLMVLDASKSEGHRQILTKELEAVGLRLNKKPPQVNLH